MNYINLFLFNLENTEITVQGTLTTRLPRLVVLQEVFVKLTNNLFDIVKHLLCA